MGFAIEKPIRRRILALGEKPDQVIVRPPEHSRNTEIRPLRHRHFADVLQAVKRSPPLLGLVDEHVAFSIDALASGAISGHPFENSPSVIDLFPLEVRFSAASLMYL